MPDSEYVPHRFVLGRNRKPGEPLSRFGHPGPVTWTIARGGDVVQLRAAIVHHLVVVGLRRATARTGTPVEDFADAAGRTPTMWTRVLAGQVVMRLTDVGAVLLAGADAVPDAQRAHALIAKITVGADEEVAARIAHAAGDPGLLQVRTVEKALGSGDVNARQPLGPQGHALLERTQEAVLRPLREAVAHAVAEHGPPPSAAADPALHLELADVPDDEPDAVGYASDEPLVGPALKPDWLDTVHGPGWALLDRRLVLDITGRGTGHRPARVTVLALVPEWNGQPPEQPRDRPAWGWAWQPADADVDWDGDHAAVTLH